MSHNSMENERSSGALVAAVAVVGTSLSMIAVAVVMAAGLGKWGAILWTSEAPCSPWGA